MALVALAQEVQKPFQRELASKENAMPDTGRKDQVGRIGWILLWLIGVPIPVLLILFLLRGCT